MKKSLLVIIAAALAVPAAPAMADSRGWDNNRASYSDYDRYDRRDRNNNRNYNNRSRQHRVYDDRGRYVEPRRVNRDDRVWRGNDGRHYCQRSNGTTGLIIGAAGGALLGREIDGGRDRTVGTVLGAALGGLLGREIDRGQARCR